MLLSSPNFCILNSAEFVAYKIHIYIYIFRLIIVTTELFIIYFVILGLIGMFQLHNCGGTLSSGINYIRVCVLCISTEVI